MTNAMATNNGIFCSEEILEEEQLEIVRGGFVQALVIAGITMMVEQGISDAKDLSTFVNSDDYKKLSNSEKNSQLGKKLANSVGFNAILWTIGSPFAVAAAQVALRTCGTGDDIRKAIEKIF